jgi:acylphosphatase
VPEIQQLHAIIRGRVQGVSFRYYTQRRADELGVVGWVRNLPDGSVEVRAQGTTKQLEDLLAFLHHGPDAARVTSVDVDWHSPEAQFEFFQIR